MEDVYTALRLPDQHCDTLSHAVVSTCIDQMYQPSRFLEMRFESRRIGHGRQLEVDIHVARSERLRKVNSPILILFY